MTRSAAAILLVISLGVAAWCFSRIARRYRTIRGFPWFPSAVFAAASIIAILALHVLIAP